MSVNPIELLSGHINDTWWISWLLNGRQDESGKDVPLAEGVYFVSDFAIFKMVEKDKIKYSKTVCISNQNNYIAALLCRNCLNFPKV
jgi:hypothetical protein